VARGFTVTSAKTADLVGGEPDDQMIEVDPWRRAQRDKPERGDAAPMTTARSTANARLRALEQARSSGHGFRSAGVAGYHEV